MLFVKYIFNNLIVKLPKSVIFEERSIFQNIMNNKSSNSKRIIYWVLTGLVVFVFMGSAIGKLTSSEEALQMAADFGLDASSYTMLGIVELMSLLLFVIPRTGVIGTFLLLAYMGGAIATHIEHGVSIVAPCIIEAVVLVVALYRFPELRATLLKSNA